jgi:hypothetical protein
MLRPAKHLLLSYKKANLAGCSLAYILAHTLLQHHRRQYEISRLYLPISSSSNDRFNDNSGHMSTSNNSRSAYIQPGHGGQRRDRSESVDTELGAWDADRYYYSAGAANGGTGGESRRYDDGLHTPEEGPTEDKPAVARAGDRDYQNVFDLGDEEDDTTLSGGQHS